jgi:hypothetical protein
VNPAKRKLRRSQGEGDRRTEPHRQAASSHPGQANNVLVISAQKVRVFISYARTDYRIAETLRDELMELNRDRVDCFLDTKTIESGEGWEKKLEEALKSAHWLLCIYTGEQSEYCGFEVGVFTGGKSSERERESSRVVCFHDVPNYPGIFRSHQNCSIEYPPERLTPGEVFDEAGFFGRSGLVKFFQDFSKFQNLYVPREEAEFTRRVESFIRKAKAITQAFRDSHGNDVKFDTPTQLGFDVIVSNKDDEPLQGIPPSAVVKGTYGTFALFHMLPPFQSELLPTAPWGSIKEAGRAVSSGYLPWVERLERDMLSAAKGQALTETEATFRGNGKTYRAILTRHIVYFNGDHKFGIVFVTTLPSEFLGDQKTSMILAGLVVASRFRFAYFEHPERVTAMFGDEVSDGDFEAGYRQLLYDLERMRQESQELGLVDHNVFIQSFGPSRKAIAEEFITEYAKAKAKLEANLPPSGAPVTQENRPEIRSAILTFLGETEDQNARFLKAALEAYRDELEQQLRTRKSVKTSGIS